LQAALTTPAKPAAWGHWQKLAISAPTRSVSPVVHQGRLSLLWPTIKTRALQALGGGNMHFTGYRHTFNLVSVSLLPTGAWGQAQTMGLPYQEGVWFDSGEGVIEEGLISSRPKYDNAVSAWPACRRLLTHRHELDAALRSSTGGSCSSSCATTASTETSTCTRARWPTIDSSPPRPIPAPSCAWPARRTETRSRSVSLQSPPSPGLAQRVGDSAIRYMYAQDVNATLVPVAFRGQPEVRLAGTAPPMCSPSSADPRTRSSTIASRSW
jgi:hypothetical protein